MAVKVLDWNGRELHPGDSVRRVHPGGGVGIYLGLSSDHVSALVEFVLGKPRFRPTDRHGVIRRTLTCPDLELIDPSTEEAG